MDMLVRYWGVRGSVPSPLSSKEIQNKQVELIKRVLKDKRKVGTTAQQIRKYLDTLPLSVSGTYGGNTTCIAEVDRFHVVCFEPCADIIGLLKHSGPQI